MGKVLVIDGQEMAFDDIRCQGSHVTVVLEGERFEFVREGQGLRPRGGGRRIAMRGVVESASGQVHLQVGGRSFWVGEKAVLEDPEQEAPGEGLYYSPMPGKVVEIVVGLGDQVKRGEPLLSLEAMKMEHTIRAGADGRVKNIFCAQGEQVANHARLLELESPCLNRH